ncbi:MAG: 16S rRNA (uracil(1498)-N(3))-methyltransferase, partial [Hyphomicrobium sp.]
LRGRMATSDFHGPRLYVEAALAERASIACTAEQANYLLNVMRLGPEDKILVFNGRDGEWCARLAEVAKRRCVLECLEKKRAQQGGPDIHYLFAPLKRSRLDYMVQKATEMGAARLQPVLTRRTMTTRVNVARMRANAIEAAEQCRVLWVPDVAEPMPIDAMLRSWDATRRLVYCDESAEVANPITALANLAPGPLAVLIGPEGGFDPDERAMLHQQAYALPISLGPRIMRADTAAVASLALVNAVLGDWR